MTKNEIREKVIDIVVEQMQVKREQVTDTAAFIDDLGADSLDIAELVMEFEDAFGINIPDNEEGLKTVGNAVDFIAKEKGV